MPNKRFDSHVHTHHSPDSSQALRPLFEAAQRAGLGGLCLTDHVEFECCEGGFTSLPDWPRRAKEIDALRDRFPALAIRQGAEIGFVPGSKERIRSIAASHPFDFILLSVHMIDGLDPYFPAFFKRYATKREAYGLYLDAVLASVSAIDDYSVVGHIGYVAKAGHCDALRYVAYDDRLDAILRRVIETGHGIEVNTSGYPVLGEPMPGLDMIKRYRELGGEIITIGSDSHIAMHVGRHFDQALALLEEAGFAYVASFEQMRPVFHPIDSWR